MTCNFCALVDSPPNFRGFKKLIVYEVSVAEGEGVEGDPVRVVKRYFTEDGELLFYKDPVVED